MNAKSSIEIQSRVQLPRREMRNRFAGYALAMFIALSTAGCASYVDPKLTSEIIHPARRQFSGVAVDFWLGPYQSPNESRRLKTILDQKLADAGLLDGSPGSPAIHLDIKDNLDDGGAILTGLTFFIVGSNQANNYQCDIWADDGHLTSAHRTYSGTEISTMGLISFPPEGWLQVPPDEGETRIMMDFLNKFLNNASADN